MSIPKELQKAYEEVENMNRAFIGKLETTTAPLYIVNSPDDVFILEKSGANAICVEDADGDYAVMFHSCVKYAEHLPPLIIALDSFTVEQKAYIGDLKHILNSKDARYFEQDLKKHFICISDMIDACGSDDVIKTEEEYNRLSPQLFKNEYNTEKAINSFIDNLDNKEAHKHIPCGLKNIDSIINGGFTDGLYVIISSTGAGKTSLCLQMANYIAYNNGGNTPVLYFSLEMPKDELIAKDLSRYLKINKVEIPAGDLLDFANKKDNYHFQTEGKIKDVAKFYKNSIAPNLYFITTPPKETCKNYHHTRITAEDISFITRDFIRRTNTKPVVFVDYFQLLGKSEEQTKNKLTTVDKAGDDAYILKALSRKEDAGVPIIAISSTARSNNNKDMGVDSAKNSGDIEYTANAVIILQPEGIAQAQEDKYELEELRSRIKLAKENGEPYSIEVKLEKDRFNPDTKTYIDFIAKYGLYRDRRIIRKNN